MTYVESKSLSISAVLMYVVTVVLIVASVIVGANELEKASLLATSIRTSGWVGYQASIESAKSRLALTKAALDPNPQNVSDAQMRLEILLSRLSVLLESEEGKFLRTVPEVSGEVKRIKGVLSSKLDIFYSDGGSGNIKNFLDQITPYFNQLDSRLQNILSYSIAYNKRVFEREAALASKSSLYPFLAAIFSGGVLLMLTHRQSLLYKKQMVELRNSWAVIERNNELVQFLFAQIPIGIVVYSLESCEVLFSNTIARASGVDLSTLCVPTIFGAHYAATRTEQASATNDAGSTSHYAISWKRVDWNDRPAALVLIVDVSEIKLAEHQLLQTAKLAVVGEMASSVAHEINQPLATIKLGAVNALAMPEVTASPKVAAKLTRISEQVDRAKRITDQVLAFARGGPSDSHTFEVHAAIDAAVEFVSLQAKLDQVEILVNFDLSKKAIALGDRTIFEQAATNILVNALHAYQGLRRRGDRYIEITSMIAPDGTSMDIFLEDRAGGIPDEILCHVFDPFFSTKQPGKGSGLGLTLARKFLRQRGGELVATNVLDEHGCAVGSRFSIRIPIEAREIIPA